LLSNGFLIFFRSVLSEAFSRGWCDGRDLKSLIVEMIVASFGIADIIAVVINSDSPEGHLPMDFFANCPNRNVTSQMLLVIICCFRVPLLCLRISLASKYETMFVDHDLTKWESLTSSKTLCRKHFIENQKDDQKVNDGSLH
jgi:hypothetical protein